MLLVSLIWGGAILVTLIMCKETLFPKQSNDKEI